MDRHEQWRVETNNMGTVELVADGENGEEWLIASASFGPLAVRQKNFALLRTAPDLLEALEPFVVLADRHDAKYRKRGGEPDAYPDSHPAYDITAETLPMGVWRKARAAIAKATGDQ